MDAALGLLHRARLFTVNVCYFGMINFLCKTLRQYMHTGCLSSMVVYQVFQGGMKYFILV